MSPKTLKLLADLTQDCISQTTHGLANFASNVQKRQSQTFYEWIDEVIKRVNRGESRKTSSLEFSNRKQHLLTCHFLGSIVKLVLESALQSTGKKS